MVNPKVLPIKFPNFKSEQSRAEQYSTVQYSTVQDRKILNQKEMNGFDLAGDAAITLPEEREIEEFKKALVLYWWVGFSLFWCYALLFGLSTNRSMVIFGARNKKR
jgi:hypothetical protein